MKMQLKVSGKKLALPDPVPSDWKFERRPGGWILATRCTLEGTIERRRFHYSREKKKFSAKFTTGVSSDFYGERVEVTRKGAGSDSASDYTAQFPGKVRKILVRESEVVAEGVALLMVEAMKMEFAIKAGSPGKVVRIHVEEGMILGPGQKLLDFEEEKK
jgi:biotin carboxyl carrier protein